MKKTVLRVTALALTILLLTLASCGGEGAVSIPEEAVSLPGVVSPEESFDAEHSVPPEEPDFMSEVVSLLERDAELTETFIFGGIYKGEDLTGDPYELHPLSETNAYALPSAVFSALGAVYTAKGAEEMLAFPEYGTSNVAVKGKKTYYSFHFVPERSPAAVPHSAELRELGKSHAVVAVSDTAGGDHEITLTLTEEGWRLDRAFWFCTHNAGETPKLTAASIGSAREARGECLVINVFIDDAESSWTDAEIKETLSRVNTALDFINSAAASYGSDFAASATNVTDSPRLTTVEKIPSEMENYIRIDLLFGGTVYGSLAGYVAEYFDTEKLDNYCVLLHLNKDGRSYSLRCDIENYDWQLYTCERAVIYHPADVADIYYDHPAVYAHEILHLFGAYDLYGEFITAANDKAIDNYFKNDIMRTVGGDIDLLGVSPFTAYACGMTGILHEQFVRFANDRP